MNPVNTEAIYKNLENPQKAALLLIALGQKHATEVMRLMNQDEMKKVSYWINQMGYVPQEITERVIKEFYEKLTHKSSLATTGGKEYLMDVLSGVVGEKHASDIIDEIISEDQNEVFRILKHVEPQQLAGYLKNEQPQTVALMLAHLHPTRSAEIIASLPAEMQPELIIAMAKLQDADPEIIAAVENALNKSLNNVMSSKSSSGRKDAKKLGGVKLAAEIMTNIGKTFEKEIMAKLVEKEFSLATAIKDLMFVFEDILLLDDKSLQKVLKDVDQNDLILSLKGASEAARNKIFSNISKRQADTINDELAFMGAVKGSVVKAAQQKIITVIRKLDEEGQIVIQSKGGGGDDIIT